MNSPDFGPYAGNTRPIVLGAESPGLGLIPSRDFVEEPPEHEPRVAVVRLEVLTPQTENVDTMLRGAQRILSHPATLDHMIVDDITDELMEGLVRGYPKTRLYAALDSQDRVVSTVTVAEPQSRNQLGGKLEIRIGMNSFHYGAVDPDLVRNEARRKDDASLGVGTQMMELVGFNEFELRFLEGKPVPAYWLRTLGVPGWEKVHGLAMHLGCVPRFGYEDLVTIYRTDESDTRSEKSYSGIEYQWTLIFYTYNRMMGRYPTLAHLPVPPMLERYFREKHPNFRQFERWVRAQQDVQYANFPFMNGQSDDDVSV